MTDTPAERDDEGSWVRRTWDRLRRRKVAQWGLAYAAGAWAVVQVFGFAADSFGWPAATKQLALLGLAFGVPLAMVLAWYHGERGGQHVTGAEVAVITLLLLLGGGFMSWWGRLAESPRLRTDPRSPAAGPRGDKSIAVLPFVNMSPDPDQEYFSDGMSEQVLDRLSQVRNLRVIARASSFAFKGKPLDVPVIAHRLGVAYVLDGSVRRSGNRVRVTAQLIDAADNSQLWSKTYDRELTDIFAIQDEIAVMVVRQLELTLLANVAAPRATTSLEAYKLYLQGRYLQERHGLDDMIQAVDVYRRAVALDPGHAAAWAALAESQWLLADLGHIEVTTGARAAKEAAGRALHFDANLARAHYVTGKIAFAHDWDWPAADASFRRALAVDPGDEGTLLGTAFLALGHGRVDEAIAQIRQAVAASPLNPSTHVWLGYCDAIAGRFDDAVTEIRVGLQLSGDFSTGWYRLGVVQLLQGHPEAALEAMRREASENWRLPGLALMHHALQQEAESDAALAEAKRRFGHLMAYQIAEVYAYRGDTDAAFEWLDRAYRQKDAGLAYYLVTDPLLKRVTGDPRYSDLLRRMNLPEPQPAGPVVSD